MRFSNETFIYKGVEVTYDEDKDERIKIFINNLNDIQRELLISAKESKGTILLFWDFHEQEMPEGYEVDGDFWGAIHSFREEPETIRNNPYNTKSFGRVVTRQTRYKVLDRQKWACNCCGVKLKYSIKQEWEAEVAHIDHIHPYSKRKTYLNGEENINEIENLQALCQKCNQKKGAKEIN